MSVDEKSLIAQLETARTDISEAEEALSIVLRELAATARAEKTTISEILQTAFAKVSSAKQDLIALEHLLKKSAQ